MPNLDETIARNVARLRGGRSQAEVAALMRELGWKWSQTTVWKVESGERPLRAAEAQGLASALGAQLQDFFTTPLRVDLEETLEHLRDRGLELIDAVNSYEETQNRLAQTADRLELEDERGIDVVTTLRLEAALRRSAEDIVLEAHIKSFTDWERKKAVEMQAMRRVPEFEHVEVVFQDAPQPTNSDPDAPTFRRTLKEARETTRERHYGEYPAAP